MLAPVLLARERRIVLPRGRGLWLALAAGLALAAHFGTFIPSLSYTTVASSAALVCTQPIWAGIIGWFLGERLPGRAWAGVGVCVLGVLAITGVDISLSGDALLGDALALAGGRIRRRLHRARRVRPARAQHARLHRHLLRDAARSGSCRCAC